MMHYLQYSMLEEGYCDSTGKVRSLKHFGFRRGDGGRDCLEGRGKAEGGVCPDESFGFPEVAENADRIICRIDFKIIDISIICVI